MTAIPSLHLISDRARCPLDLFPELARSAAEGGVDAVHIRERDLPDDELMLLTEQVKSALSGSGCLLLVNARVDVAVRAGADGVASPAHALRLATDLRRGAVLGPDQRGRWLHRCRGGRDKRVRHDRPSCLCSRGKKGARRVWSRAGRGVFLGGGWLAYQRAGGGV
jgi:hypothetical protein